MSKATTQQSSIAGPRINMIEFRSLRPNWLVDQSL